MVRHSTHMTVDSVLVSFRGREDDRFAVRAVPEARGHFGQSNNGLVRRRAERHSGQPAFGSMRRRESILV